MVESSKKPRGRVTPSQWLTIGILASVFVVVLIVQFGRAGVSSQPASATDVPVPNSRRPLAENPTADGQVRGGRRPPPKPDRTWPVLALATVLAYDPFARPSSLVLASGGIPSGNKSEDSAAHRSEDAEKKRADRQRALAQVRLEVVRAVVGTDKGFAAVVGTKTVRVGDRLHGLRVKEIRPDGVVLDKGGD